MPTEDEQQRDEQERQPAQPVAQPPQPTIQTTAPRLLNDIRGQSKAVEQLRVALAAHRRELQDGRRSSFPHLLLDGPPGLGKTMFAGVIANELEGTVKEMLGQSLGKLEDLHATLIEATDKTILNIDEAHLADLNAQTALLRAVEDRVLLIPRRGQKREMRIPLARFTLVLATTDPQGLIGPLRERMQIGLHLEYYRPQDLAGICDRRAQQLGWEIAPTTCAHIGRASQGTPRIALRNLEGAWRLSRSEGAEEITFQHFQRAMKLAQLDPVLGLDVTQRRYLDVIRKSGGTARVSIIAARLGLPVRQLVTVIEPFLVRAGMVLRLEHGRTLTNHGDQTSARLEVDDE
ncbi:MAG: AAA family ATPase [Planctomycetales bacterium]|nr:AAA family ATPase [Planctomycetales bacterium]